MGGRDLEDPSLGVQNESATQLPPTSGPGSAHYGSSRPSDPPAWSFLSQARPVESGGGVVLGEVT